MAVIGFGWWPLCLWNQIIFQIKKEESYMESKDNFEFPIDNSIPVTEWINFTTWTGKKICPFTYDEQRR